MFCCEGICCRVNSINGRHRKTKPGTLFSEVHKSHLVPLNKRVFGGDACHQSTPYSKYPFRLYIVPQQLKAGSTRVPRGFHEVLLVLLGISPELFFIENTRFSGVNTSYLSGYFFGAGLSLQGSSYIPTSGILFTAKSRKNKMLQTRTRLGCCNEPSAKNLNSLLRVQFGQPKEFQPNTRSSSREVRTREPFFCSLLFNRGTLPQGKRAPVGEVSL